MSGGVGLGRAAVVSVLGGVLGSLPPSPARADCDVVGTVLDDQETPLPRLDVSLGQGPAARHTLTDEQGRFRFAAVPEATEVTVWLREGGPAPRFVIIDEGQPASVSAPVDPDGACELILGPGTAHPLDRDRVALARGLARGFALMEQLGIRPQSPLRVEVNDAVASPREAYWIGPSSFSPTNRPAPRLVLGTAATRHDDPGAPDNREYHELGHHALATAFGALPRARNEVPGGGYHHDPSSARAWTEGFAIFFAAMVARDIEQRPHPHRYRVGGAWLDLEQNYRPWDLRGLDAVAVASMLWDVTDGAREGSASDLEVTRTRLLTEAGVPHLLVGRVINPSDAPIASAYVRVDAPGWTGAAPVGPAVLEPGGEGRFALPLPAAVAEGDDPLSALRIHAGTDLAAPDDDPVQVPLATLWTAISELRSERADSNGRLFDVADLYHALRGRLGGQDADGDGRDDIDQLFITHGLFADVNGSRAYEPGEALGLTSHPATTVEVDGAPESWPALDPRHRLTLPAGLSMEVDVEPADAWLMVLASGSAEGGYAAARDDDGRVLLVPPPAREGATASVVALSAGRRPTVAWHQDATRLLTSLEAHRVPFLSAAAQLPVESDDARTGGPAPSWARTAFAGGGVAVLVGLVLMAIGWPRPR